MLSEAALLPSAVSAAALGFLLGLRHATDADHVVAVTTIVARERTLARAARVGALWGIGHSLTLFVVGGADRKSTRLNSSHSQQSRMPSSA